MTAYTVIADVSAAIRERLAVRLVPEFVISPEGVALCSPGDRGDTAVGIFLYDIQESDVIRQNRMIDVGDERQQYPSMYLSLYYMITVYPTGERRYRMGQEERILGLIAQYFHDYPAAGEGSNPARLELQSVSTEDKLKLWNYPGEAYRVSLFYKAAPVEVASARFREVSRVRERRVSVEPAEKGGCGGISHRKE